MKTLQPKQYDRHLRWFNKTAGSVMVPNPVSISRSVSVFDAADFLTEKGISAAPVIDEAGRPLGVLSRADIVRHTRNSAGAEHPSKSVTVEDIMTPVVYFARQDTPLMSVIDDLLACKIHRLFVVDDHGVLIGVISTLDVLRSLPPDIRRRSPLLN